MPNHTPGPWEQGTRNGHTIYADKVAVAQVAFPDKDAGLIAAAPELARCLKAIVYGELEGLVFTACALKDVEDAKRALKAAGVI